MNNNTDNNYFKNLSLNELLSLKELKNLIQMDIVDNLSQINKNSDAFKDLKKSIIGQILFLFVFLGLFKGLSVAFSFPVIFQGIFFIIIASIFVQIFKCDIKNWQTIKADILEGLILELWLKERLENVNEKLVIKEKYYKQRFKVINVKSTQISHEKAEIEHQEIFTDFRTILAKEKKEPNQNRPMVLQRKRLIK